MQTYISRDLLYRDITVLENILIRQQLSLLLEFEAKGNKKN